MLAVPEARGLTATADPDDRPVRTQRFDDPDDLATNPGMDPDETSAALDEEWLSPRIEALLDPDPDDGEVGELPPEADEPALTVLDSPNGAAAGRPLPPLSISPERMAELVQEGKSQPSKRRSSWWPVDLVAVMTADLSPLEPTELVRSDGVRLLYPGRLHDFHGEPESLKSFAAQVAASTVLMAGGTVFYIDHESEARDVVGHLVALGVPLEVIISGLVYIRPEEPLPSPKTLLEAFPLQSDLTVIDGVDAAMGLHSLNPSSALEYRRWVEMEARPLQRRTVGPTVTVDHVVKSKENRGDWQGGTGAKRAAINGAAFGFELVQAFGRGRTGVVRLLLHKDRVGALRGIEGPGKEVARLRLTSHEDGHITHELLPPPATTGGTTERPRWQPTWYMERVSLLVEQASEPMSRNAIETAVQGKREHIRQAINELVAGGYLTAVGGARNSSLHQSLKPYREAPE